MSLAALDAGWVGVAGAVCTLIGALAAPVMVHRLGKEDVERSLRENRESATIQHARELARQFRKESLDAFIEFLGDEEQLFLALYHRSQGIPLPPLEAASQRSYMRVRLLASAELQPKLLALWKSTTAFGEAQLTARQLPTKEDMNRALESPLREHSEALFSCMAAMTLALDDIVDERDLSGRLASG
jgi:hypothetical protein